MLVAKIVYQNWKSLAMDAMEWLIVYENAKTAISEKNPIVTRKTDDSYLIDEEFYYMHFNTEKNDLRSAANKTNW
jgi:acyl-CoA oxidase